MQNILILSYLRPTFYCTHAESIIFQLLVQF